MYRNDTQDLDFDHLLKLAKNDPVKFEDMRQNAIDTFIATLPNERQIHLRRLQWKIDQERRNRSPLSACMHISGLMWENLVGPKGILGYLKGVNSDTSGLQTKANRCEILEFPSRSS
jgi:hypothetical protein